MGQANDTAQAGGGQFTETRWSLVLLAGDEASSRSREAREHLCRAYWQPIYLFVRRHGHSPHDAQDLTQEFIARLLEKNLFATADRERGRFRSFLLGALKHFLADEWDKARAEKRGGNAWVLPIDDTQAEDHYLSAPASDLTPERLFDRRWGLTLLQQAMERLKAESSTSDKLRQFELLKPFLTDPAGSGGYDTVAAQLDTTPASVAVSVHRLRQRFRELVRAEVAQTVASPADVDDELRALFS